MKMPKLVNRTPEVPTVKNTATTERKLGEQKPRRGRPRLDKTKARVSEHDGVRHYVYADPRKNTKISSFDLKILNVLTATDDITNYEMIHLMINSYLENNGTERQKKIIQSMMDERDEKINKREHYEVED